jgi:hypothetical protein
MMLSTKEFKVVLAASKMVTLKKMTALMPENCCPNMSSRVIKSGFRFCRLVYFNGTI